MSHFTLAIEPGRGPILNAAIFPSEAQRAALTAAGKPLPTPYQIRALVDTGASCTCVDPKVFATLGISPTGKVPMHTPSTGGTPVELDQYDVTLAVPGAVLTDPALLIPTVAVVASELHDAQGIHALIGRDILSRCVLIYNGSTGFFTLSY